MAELTLEDYEKLNPKFEISHDGKKMFFSTPSTFTFWRAESIYEKEPWTLEWISEFAEGDTLIDIGANVGMYSIWAAATRKVKVYSFEPESMNYALLNKNILLNNLMGNIKAFPCGLSDKNELTSFFMSDMRIGGSNHAAGEPLNFNLKKMEPVFIQGCITFTLDYLIEKKFIEVPNHIKIDVDGFEHKVINGAKNTLSKKQLKTLLIETNQNLEEHMNLIGILKEYGFSFDANQVKRAERKDGIFKGVAEYVFRR
jgi:FkbM family methyltransferase